MPPVPIGAIALRAVPLFTPPEVSSGRCINRIRLDDIQVCFPFLIQLLPNGMCALFVSSVIQTLVVLSFPRQLPPQRIASMAQESADFVRGEVDIDDGMFDLPEEGLKGLDTVFQQEILEKLYRSSARRQLMRDFSILL